MSVECVADVRAVLGEGPVWVEREQALYWVDIEADRLFRWSEADGVRIEAPDIPLSALAPRRGGGFVGAGREGFVLIEDGEARRIGNPEAECPGNRFNDGKVDREGRFWAGTMDEEEKQASGALYRLDPDLRWSRIDGGYHVTNGPAFSVDGRTLYHSDSGLQRVYAFDLDSEGRAKDRRVFLQFDEGEGYPDGMTVDSEGGLWIAFWDGWCVRRFSPAGEPLQRIDLPVQRPTSCAFGGPELDRLFVTSARRDLDDAALARQPQAGGLFMVRPGVTGMAEPLFAG